MNNIPASLKYVLGIGPDPDPRLRAKCHQCNSLFRLDALARDIVCPMCIEQHKAKYPITIKREGVKHSFTQQFRYRIWIEHPDLPNRSGMLQVQVWCESDGWQSNLGYPMWALRMGDAMAIIHNTIAVRVQRLEGLGL